MTFIVFARKGVGFSKTGFGRLGRDRGPKLSYKRIGIPRLLSPREPSILPSLVPKPSSGLRLRSPVSCSAFQVFLGRRFEPAVPSSPIGIGQRSSRWTSPLSPTVPPVTRSFDEFSSPGNPLRSSATSCNLSCTSNRPWKGVCFARCPLNPVPLQF